MARIRRLDEIDMPETWGLLLLLGSEFFAIFCTWKWLYINPVKFPAPWSNLSFAVRRRQRIGIIFVVWASLMVISGLWAFQDFLLTRLTLHPGRINNLLQRLVLLGFGPFLLSTLCFAASVIQLYFRTRVKRFFPGYRRRRADILLYTEQSDDEYLISNTWFDIVDLVSKTDDQREAIFKPNDWIQKFMEVPQLGKSHELSPEEFGTARAKFNENPGDFVRCLEKFSHDLHIRDLAESILVYCTDPSQTPEERRKRLQCWLTLNAKIHEINNRVLDPPATTAAYTYPEPDGIRTILDELKAQRGLENTGDELLRFFNKCIVDYIPQEDEIENSWKLEELRTVFHSWDAASRATLYQIAHRLKLCFEFEFPLSATHHQFQVNVIAFTATITTSSNSKTDKEAFKLLRDTGAERHQQWQILYSAIKDLNNELAKKKKAIACLAYRHVLEHLPNQDSAAWKALWTIRGRQTSATGKWKVTWELAVGQELLMMVNEYNGRPAVADPGPAGLVTKVGAAVPTAARRPGATGPVAALAAALSATATAAAAAAPGPVVKPPQPQRLKPLIRSDFDYHVGQWVRNFRGAPVPPLSINDLGDWTTWPSYDRGKILYSSLSGSIHTFGNAYEVDDSNWLSSDAAILAWLRPNGPVDATTKEVVWGDEWVTEKRLPA